MKSSAMRQRVKGWVRRSRDGGFSLAEYEDRLVWIFGSSRSGSSWLLRMLADLDGVAGIDDPHLGHHLGVWRPIPLAWATSEQPPSLTTLTDLKRHQDSYFFSDRYEGEWRPALKRLIQARFEAEARDRLNGLDGRPSVVVKEPGSHAAELLRSLFPRSKLVFLLRDGRDVVDSWLSAYQRGSWALEEGAFPVASWGRLPFIRWQASVWLFRTEVVQRAYASHDPGNRIVVRYEDLRSDPTKSLVRLCARLGVDADLERLHVAAQTQAYEQVPPHSKGEDKAIRFARPGSWRDNMSAREQRVMHDILAPKLAELGYLLDTPPTTGAESQRSGLAAVG
jgi:LPS sulfotransferase NodH